MTKPGGAEKICICCGVQFIAASNFQKYCFKIDQEHREHKAEARRLIKNSSNSRRSYSVSTKRKRRQHHLGMLKLKHGCLDCGFNSHYEALHFDHLDPKKKSFTIGAKFGTVSLQELFAEIRKCVIRCANCHAIKSRKNHDYIPLKKYDTTIHKTRHIRRTKYK